MVNKSLLTMLVCPITRAPLTYDEEAQELISSKARLAYPVRSGIPIMLEAEARSLDTPRPTAPPTAES